MNTSSVVTLATADQGSMNAYTAWPEGPGPFAGLLLLQEAFGVNHHIRQVADRLAREGYAVIAPELFHRSAPAGFEASYTDFSTVTPHLQALQTEGLEQDLRAAHGWLMRQPRVRKDRTGSIGFCLGGRVSFLANIILPLSASVSYYGSNIPALLNRSSEIHAPHLFFWGGLDKHIPASQMDSITGSLKQAGKPFTQVLISYADHGFHCDERASYNPQAAAEAWAMTCAFLRNRLE